MAIRIRVKEHDVHRARSGQEVKFISSLYIAGAGSATSASWEVTNAVIMYRQ